LNSFLVTVNGKKCSLDNNVFYLERGKEARFSITCDNFDIEFSTSPVVERNIEIELAYNYFYDVSTKIDVIGSKVYGKN